MSLNKISQKWLAQFSSAWFICFSMCFCLTVVLASLFSHALPLLLLYGILAGAIAGATGARLHIKSQPPAMPRPQTGATFLVVFYGASVMVSSAFQVLGLTGNLHLIVSLLLGLICATALRIMSLRQKPASSADSQVLTEKN